MEHEPGEGGPCAAAERGEEERESEPASRTDPSRDRGESRLVSQALGHLGKSNFPGNQKGNVMAMSFSLASQMNLNACVVTVLQR